MHRRYMAAAIRNQFRRDDPMNWGDQDLLDSFALLPAQSLSFEEWASSPLVSAAAEDEEIDTCEKIERSGLVERGIVEIS